MACTVVKISRCSFESTCRVAYQLNITKRINTIEREKEIELTSYYDINITFKIAHPINWCLILNQ